MLVESRFACGVVKEAAPRWESDGSGRFSVVQPGPTSVTVVSRKDKGPMPAMATATLENCQNEVEKEYYPMKLNIAYGQNELYIQEDMYSSAERLAMFEIDFAETTYDQPRRRRRVGECIPIRATRKSQALEAIVQFEPANAGSPIVGALLLTQDRPGSPVKVTGSVQGLKPGEHELRVHQVGNTADGCEAAGDHYDPLKVSAVSFPMQ